MLAVEREAIGYFKDLLRIDTTNPPGNERRVVDYLGAILQRERIPFQVVEPLPGRASLVARLTGSGEKAPLLLNAHTDVVPADAERWQKDPFGAIEEDGFIWGRGAIDMKNMLSMSLMTLLRLKRENVPLARDVILAAVADEEAGCRYGSLFLTKQHPELVRAEYVLNEVGGHTLHMPKQRFCPIQVSEKGLCWFELHAEGPAGHGSMPHPHSAVARLARAVAALASTRLPEHVSPVVERFLRTLSTGAHFPQNTLMPLMLAPSLAGYLLDQLEKKNLSQALAINAMLRNTATPTLLSAGKKVNVIPSSATATIDGRTIPGQTVASFLAEVQSLVGEDITLNVLVEHEGVVFSEETELYSKICTTVQKHDPEVVPVPYMIPGFTDAFAYAQLGATCYGFSPVKLEPEVNFASMYHGHDERIPVDGFLWGLSVLYDLVKEFCQASAS